MELIGYFASVLIGISLGLIGGGGSILTVPVLVYFFAISPTQATAYSLFIVGFTSLIGALKNYRQKQVSVSTALLFGTTSMVTVFITRKFLIPFIPEILFSIHGFTVSKSFVTMVLFACLMLVAAFFMIRKQNISVDPDLKTPYAKLAIYGLGVGLLTGFLGAGGGFVLIPTLVLLLKLPMKKAVGTSLLIIAFNSLIGFIGDLEHILFNWFLMGKITALAVAGIYVGTILSRKVQGNELKVAFGWFVMAMGFVILIKEIIF